MKDLSIRNAGATSSSNLYHREHGGQFKNSAENGIIGKISIINPSPIQLYKSKSLKNLATENVKNIYCPCKNESNNFRHSALNKMLLIRGAMQVLQPKCIDQDPANPNHVYELRKSGNGQYQMVNVVSGLPGAAPDGAGWVFIIPDDSPDRVLCGKADYKNVHGHTSLSGMREYIVEGKFRETERGVYFAGELVFRAGQLIQWSNCSGHFTPEREAAFKNILPSVKHVLPVHLFRPVDSWP
ncbi:hypothetical protein [Scandinavium sp.]|uniref:hypothetical protein n=1 Tax=Scandinavium sp. TaxID=2830653 RepID=UPI0028A141C1|nr:hypothetical protein [Scandinavium sp.]